MPNLNFTMPSTESHVAYHNRFGGTRKFLGRISFVFLIAWAAADFFGMSELILPQFPVISIAVTALLLYASHTILYYTTRACGYDLFDGSGKLESGFFIILPLFLSAVMLWFSYLGAEKIIQNHIVHKPVLQNDSTTLLSRQKEYAQISARFSQDSAQTAAPYAEQIGSIKSQYAAKINQRKSAKTYDRYDVIAKTNAVKALEAQRDGEVAGVVAQYAAELKLLNQGKQKDMAEVAALFGDKLTNIKNHNNSEIGKKNTDEASADGWAWLFSGGMCLLFWLTTLFGCRIDCKSGIIPVYNHTEGDQHDVLDKLTFVVQDIFRSRVNNIFVNVHEKLAVDYKELKQKGAFTETPPPPQYPNNAMPPPPTAPPSGGNDGGMPPPQTTPPPPPIEKRKLFALPYNDAQGYWRNETAAIFATKSDVKDHFWRMAFSDINPIIAGYTDGSVSILDKDLSEVLLLATAYQNKSNEQQEEDTPTPSLAEIAVTPTPVITDTTSVITDDADNQFAYGDKLLKSLKSAANVEVCNWKNKNGTPKSIRNRCIEKSRELDEVIRNVKATPSVRKEICDYFADNITPITSTKFEDWEKASKGVTNE